MGLLMMMKLKKSLTKVMSLICFLQICKAKEKNAKLLKQEIMKFKRQVILLILDWSWAIKASEVQIAL